MTGLEASFSGSRRRFFPPELMEIPSKIRDNFYRGLPAYNPTHKSSSRIRARGRTIDISQITLGGPLMPDETPDHSSPRAVFKCSQELLDAIDLTAAASFTTRSNIIRDAVVDRLRREGVIPSPGAALVGS